MEHVSLIARMIEHRLQSELMERTLAPNRARGFRSACADLQPDKAFIVYPGEERFPLGDGAEAVPLIDLARQVAARAFKA